MLPSGPRLLLDYRTQPQGEPAARSSAKRTLVIVSLLVFVAVLLARALAGRLHGKPGVLAGLTLSFWCGIFPVCLVIALVQYLRGRPKAHLANWLVTPLLVWAVLYVTTVGFNPVAAYVMLFVPSVAFAIWVADRMAMHYAAWLSANPHLDFETRATWARRWNARRITSLADLSNLVHRAGFLSVERVDPEESEPAAYPLAMIGLLACAVLSFVAFLFYRSAAHAEFFAGMLAVLSFFGLLIGLWMLWNSQLQPHRISLRMVRRVTWSALINWLSYNAHETHAPGVFQSPVGGCAKRIRLFGWAVFLLSLSILPLAAYFPVVLFVSGPAPWLSTVMPTPSAGPIAPVTSATLDDSEKLYYQYLRTPAEKDAYLAKVFERRRALTAERDLERSWRDAYAALTVQPERWFRAAMQRAFSPHWYFSLAFFVSFLLSLVAGPVAFFLIFVFIAGRMLTLYETALEAPLAYEHHPGRSAWDGRVARLQASPIRGKWNETQVRERDHLWLGSSVLNDYPVLLSRNILAEHAHIMGSTGSGKTALGLAPLITQMIRLADSSVVIIDLKGDNALFVGAKEEAAAAGLPFQWFTNEFGCATHVFNPLHQAHRARLSTYQRTDLLIGAFGLHYSRAYGEAYFSDVQNHLLFRALRHEPDCPTFRRLYDLLRNRALYRDMDKKDLRDASHIWKIVDRLASFPALNATDGDGTPREALDQAIDVGDVFRGPRVLYFYLPAALESVAVAEIARLALYDLLTAAVTRKEKSTKVFLFIDEFQQIVSSNLEIILRQARKFGIGVILANQTLADLKTREADLTPIVTGNTNFRQIFSVSDVFHQDLLIKASGEAFYQLASVTEKFGEFDVIRTQETVGPRLWRNDIIDFSNHPQRSFAHIDRSHGYSQFGGYPFIVTSKFHITKEEYERRNNTPWPTGDAATITPLADTSPNVAERESPTVKRPTRPKVDYSAEQQTLEEFLNQVMANEDVEDGDDAQQPQAIP